MRSLKKMCRRAPSSPGPGNTLPGPLAANHIRKVADRSKLVDGDWVKADYQYQVHIQFVSETQTLVWVDARIRGLKRAFVGGDEWLPLNSTGKLEEDLLTLFGQHLFGQSFALAPTPTRILGAKTGPCPGRVGSPCRHWTRETSRAMRRG